MTESAAIPQYLATRYGPSPLAVDIAEPDYGLWLDWLHRGEATLTFPQTIVLRYTRLEPESRRLQQAADDGGPLCTVVPVAATPRHAGAWRPGMAVRRPLHHGGRVRRLRPAAGGDPGP